ncbi:hypothetical protein QX233_22520, partial [Chryseobacterium gambrini]
GPWWTTVEESCFGGAGFSFETEPESDGRFSDGLDTRLEVAGTAARGSVENGFVDRLNADRKLRSYHAGVLPTRYLLNPEYVRTV